MMPCAIFFIYKLYIPSVFLVNNFRHPIADRTDPLFCVTGGYKSAFLFHSYFFTYGF